MADSTIQDLPPASVITGDNILPLVQSGDTKSATVQTVFTDTLTSDQYGNVLGLIDGMANHRPSLSYVLEDNKVFLEVEAVGGGDLTFTYANGDTWVLNCTTNIGTGGKARTEIEQGTVTDTRFTVNYVTWSEQEGAPILVNSSELPVGRYNTIAYTAIQDYPTVATEGMKVYQRTTEVMEHGEHGALARMRENMRLATSSRWWDGMSPTLTITPNPTAMDNVNLTITSGVGYQLNRQTTPALDIAVDGIYLSGISGNGTLQNLQKITDLNEITETSLGQTLGDGNLLIMDVSININYDHASCALFVTPDSELYTDEATAKLAAKLGRNLPQPDKSQSVNTPLCRILLKYSTANNGTIVNAFTGAQEVWNESPFSATTPNYPSSYPSNSDVYIAEITKTGASKMQLLFDDFLTQTNADFIYIEDEAYTVIQTLSGDLGAFSSQEVLGETIRAHFTSNANVNRRGARIVGYRWAETIPAGAEVIDLRQT